MPAHSTKTMNPVDWALLGMLSVLWGGSFFFQGVAVKELPTLTVVVSRVALAAVTLWVVALVLKIPIPLERRVWVAFVGMGLLNNVLPFSLIVWAQSHIASGLASILNATTPLFTVIVAHCFTSDEKITGARLFGVTIGLVGVTLMIGADALDSLGNNVLAQAACLAAAISYAFAGVFGRRFKKLGVAPMAAATGQLTASSLVLVPLMLVVDRPWTLAIPGSAAIGALFGVAIFSTALAYAIYFRLLASAGATNLLLVTFLIPVSAVSLGVLVLGESLLTKHVFGMALIGLGLAAIDGRIWRALRLADGRKARPAKHEYEEGGGI